MFRNQVLCHGHVKLPKGPLSTTMWLIHFHKPTPSHHHLVVIPIPKHGRFVSLGCPHYQCGISSPSSPRCFFRPTLSDGLSLSSSHLGIWGNFAARLTLRLGIQKSIGNSRFDGGISLITCILLASNLGFAYGLPPKKTSGFLIHGGFIMMKQ